MYKLQDFITKNIEKWFFKDKLSDRRGRFLSFFSVLQPFRNDRLLLLNFRTFACKFKQSIEVSGAAAAGRFGPEGRESVMGKKQNDRERLTTSFQTYILQVFI